MQPNLVDDWCRPESVTHENLYGFKMYISAFYLLNKSCLSSIYESAPWSMEAWSRPLENAPLASTRLAGTGNNSTVNSNSVNIVVVQCVLCILSALQGVLQYSMI